MRLANRLTCVAAAFVAVVAVSSSASAHSFSGASGQTGCGVNAQDNGTMTYRRHTGLTTAMRNAVASTLANRVAPTDMTVAAELSSIDSNTDVVYWQANYTGSWCGGRWHEGPGSHTGGWVGYAYCRSLSGQRCQRSDVYFDQSFEVNATTTERLWLACHETGHTLGLQHVPRDSWSGTPEFTTCMNESVFTSTAYHSHEIGHINAFY